MSIYIITKKKEQKEKLADSESTKPFNGKIKETNGAILSQEVNKKFVPLVAMLMVQYRKFDQQLKEGHCLDMLHEVNFSHNLVQFQKY